MNYSLKFKEFFKVKVLELEQTKKQPSKLLEPTMKVLYWLIEFHYWLQKKLKPNTIAEELSYYLSQKTSKNI